MRNIFVLLAIIIFASQGWSATTGPTVSGLHDQQAIAVTIYNSNLALVKDQRAISLSGGTGELRFMDVAARIIPSSVHISSLADPSSLVVLEQNYEYDLLSPQKLMDKYVGREVTLYEKSQFTNKEEAVTATLLSNNQGPVFQTKEGITFGHPGRLIFPSVPEDLISKPTLVWLLDNRSNGRQKLETSYLTEGITWRADYVLTLDENDSAGSLTGWVTIDNQSGATYRNALIKLVAGEVNRVHPEQQFDEFESASKRFKMVSAPSPQFKEQSFFEYHLYTLQRPSTIKDNQTKQINLLTAEGIPVKKELEIKGSPSYFYDQLTEPLNNLKAGVFVEIENKEKNHLGMPLPKGTVRVYKKDTDGSLQFIGEDSIDHTPKDEKIRIKLGDAFDVVATRKQTDWKKLGKNHYEAAFELAVRNHKKEDVTVKIVEPIPGDWKIISSSYPATKGGAFAAEFSIPVPADGEAKLIYRVRMKF